LGRRRLAFEGLEGRVLLAVGDLRLVTYNVAATDGTPSTELGTVLSAIGSEIVAGQSRQIDILALQEVATQATTTASIVSQLNAVYGANAYASGSLNGRTTNTFAIGDTVGLIYNVQTVQLVNELAIGTVSSTGQPRQTIRYQLRPLGVSPVTDFYVYNSHFKSSNTTADEARRQVEAIAVRANADALPQGTHIIYAGDFNVYSSSEDPFQTLLAAGNGQAFDPVNRLGSWSNNASFLNVFTQAPAVNPPGALVGGGLDDRFDFQLQSGEWTDGASLEYVPNSYHTFGNNGSVPINSDINAASSTALAGLTNRLTVLNLLASVTDHLPVVADFRFISTVVEQFVSYIGGNYLQSFDGLPSAGTYALASNGPLFLDALPIGAQNLAGWEMANVGGSVSPAKFNFGTGSLTTGSIYSFGASNAAERALGTLATGSMIGWFGVNLVNNSGKTLTSFSLNYIGEKWREGGSNTADTLAFSYGLGAQNITIAGSGTFTDFSGLNFVSPTVSTTGGAVNGNLLANQTNKSATVNGIQWLAGQRLVLRWKDVDDSGSDDGLAIDDLTFSASAAQVLSRNIYYRGTTFDTTASSETAIDGSKVPLISGVATAANYSAFTRGLTGVIIDVRDLTSTSLTTADFEFRVGNHSTPSNWPILPATSLSATNPIVVLPGLGSSGSSRIKIHFEDNAIRRSWLQITLKANANTGLAAYDVFFFGNLSGDVVNTSSGFVVDSEDMRRVRQTASSALVLASKVEDINKDGRVNAIDIALARQQSLSNERLYRLNIVGGAPIRIAFSVPAAPTVIVPVPALAPGELQEIVRTSQSMTGTVRFVLSNSLLKPVYSVATIPTVIEPSETSKPSRELSPLTTLSVSDLDQFFSALDKKF